jgi:hypothetical protein
VPSSPRRLAPIDGQPVGFFHAVAVRDGASVERDGDPIYALRELNDQLFEVLFADGVWMLCGEQDIEPS